MLAAIALSGCTSQDGAPGYSAIDSGGVTLDRRGILDFSGPMIACSDDAPRTSCEAGMDGASGRAVDQTAAVPDVAEYTLGSEDASFLLAANVNVTASGTHSFAVQVDYTDETGATVAQTLVLAAPDGTLGTLITAGGTYAGVPVLIRAQAASSITCSTSGTFTDVTYTVECDITEWGEGVLRG